MSVDHIGTTRFSDRGLHAPWHIRVAVDIVKREPTSLSFAQWFEGDTNLLPKNHSTGVMSCFVKESQSPQTRAWRTPSLYLHYTPFFRRNLKNYHQFMNVSYPVLCIGRTLGNRGESKPVRAPQTFFGPRIPYLLFI